MTDDIPVTRELAREQGLSDAEWDRILSLLGRAPSFPELGIFAVLWSEHCSYKSSRPHLAALPRSGPGVVVGAGENAGAISIGHGLAVVFKIESHNHPSFIEPVQGAATGVGGILRDIFTMGARPVASLNSIRFGPLEEPPQQYLLRGVVAGIGGYGNCVGVPTVGGETGFHPCYRGNTLVNAFALGVVAEDRIASGRARGVGNPVIYAGSKTGRDGIHGASLLASAGFDREAADKRPAVQVGDPFLEKCLIEACLEVLETGLVVGMQDLGAAGLSSASFEMAERGGSGLELDLDRVPQRVSGLSAYEILLSESQERMLLVAQRGAEDRILERFAHWELDAAVVGRVTDDGRVRAQWRGAPVVDLPVQAVVGGAPVPDRPRREPADLGARRQLGAAQLAPEADLPAALEALLDAPDLGAKRWVWRQYDSLVQANTVVGPGGDAAVVRIRDEAGAPTPAGVALSVDCNPRWCWLDPYRGAAAAVAEAARNVACTGARPLAISDCLNFGNPERPEVMWEFYEAVRGLADAATALATPVVSGNVSFYNETEGRSIYPTPTVAAVGLLPAVARHAVSYFPEAGLAVILLGTTRRELGGSAWLALRRGAEAGRPPQVDFDHERRLHGLLAETVAAGAVPCAHDVGEGGLAVALAECCIAGPGGAGPGAEIGLPAALPPDVLLFAESTGRVLVASPRPEAVLAAAARWQVAARWVGQTGGERLCIRPDPGEAEASAEARRNRGAGAVGPATRAMRSPIPPPWIDLPVGHLAEIWERALPRRLRSGSGTARDGAGEAEGAA